jgi:hypothetical protein
MKPTQTPTTTPAPDPLRPSALLRGAALYLNKYGWIKGDFFDLLTEQTFPPACALGAINICAHGRPIVNSDDLADDGLTDAAISAARAFAAYLDSDYAAGVKDTSAIDIVSAYNDHKDTILAEVVDFLHQAANDWETTHPTGGAR